MQNVPQLQTLVQGSAAWDAELSAFARVSPEYRAWKQRRRIPQSAPVFLLVGQNVDDLRHSLLRRGWYENTEGAASTMYDLKWVLKARDARRVPLVPGQVVNHFPEGGELTTKLGLVRNLRENCMFAQVRGKECALSANADPAVPNGDSAEPSPTMPHVPIAHTDTFFPRAYDLGETGEREAFRLDFVRCAALCVLRRIARDLAFHPRGVTREAFNGACYIVEAWHTVEGYLVTNDALDVAEEAKRASLDAVMRASTAVMITASSPMVCAEHPPPPGAPALDAADELRLDRCLKKVEECERQASLGCTQNLWILKPGGKSRGRGISVVRSLGRIAQLERDGLEGKNGEYTTRWVVQKYVESPLLVQRRKFDIRQWVLVTSFAPLTIWWFDECYVRFCAEDYDNGDTDNAFRHLTNNSVAKHSAHFDSRSIGEGNMWDQETFASHLRMLTGHESTATLGWPDDPWTDVVLPGMQRAAVQALRSVEGNIPSPSGCFALYGLDFMVSESGPDPWLLEVNSSPCLEHSTSVTARLVPRLMESLCRVLVDQEKDGGGFSLLYRGPVKSTSVYSLSAGVLEVHGRCVARSEGRALPTMRVQAPMLMQSGGALGFAKADAHAGLRLVASPYQAAAGRRRGSAGDRGGDRLGLNPVARGAARLRVA